MRIAVMIPAYKPDDKIFGTLQELQNIGFQEFLLIDDGSGETFAPIFQQAQAQFACHVVHHSVNLGKGRALKTGFNYFLREMNGWDGVITVDADGQHAPSAVLNVAKAMQQYPDHMVLGVRQFLKGKNVPLKNLMGNKITVAAFWLLTGMEYGDTQCGLRGFPTSVIRKIIEVPGERFEYENNMLLTVRSQHIDVCKVPMEAIYLNDNETSHFNPMVDSVRIYSNILKFALPAITSGIISLHMFLWLKYYMHPWLATGAGSVIGSIVLLFFYLGKRKTTGLFSGLLVGLLQSGLYLWLSVYINYSTNWWWLTAIPAAILTYIFYLHIRYGNRPKIINL